MLFGHSKAPSYSDLQLFINAKKSNALPDASTTKNSPSKYTGLFKSVFQATMKATSTPSLANQLTQGTSTAKKFSFKDALQRLKDFQAEKPSSPVITSRPDLPEPSFSKTASLSVILSSSVYESESILSQPTFAKPEHNLSRIFLPGPCILQAPPYIEPTPIEPKQAGVISAEVSENQFKVTEETNMQKKICVLQ